MPVNVVLPLDPMPNTKNVVMVGRARFTLLTPRMIRMEWAQDARFEDRASFAVNHRAMPTVAHSVTKRGGSLVIDTGELRLEYKDTGKPFSKSNLSIRFRFKGREVRWVPGMKDPLNLKGTYRTLDTYDGEKGYEDGKPVRLRLDNGLISRSGWAVVDDTGKIVLEDRPEIVGGKWVAPRSEGKHQDLYFLAYGHDYKEALRDFSRVSGPQPLPPRFTLGMWWTRYWAYTAKEIETLVDDFERHDVPLDVMIIDIDWHLPGWTGYTWDPRHFPNHKEFLAHLKSRGLKVALNLHPADGVHKHEETFERFAKRMGKDPKKTKCIEFDCTDPDYVRGYFEELHHPHEKAGIDFWWIDWQQGTKTKMPGLDALPWLNHLHARDLEWRGKRPLTMSRYGGLGGGRYPLGFSGDAMGTWDSLSTEAWFTPNASNVLFGYWSHDIGGILPKDKSPELFTRWVQFGAFSPVLRTHVCKEVLAERRIWEYPEEYFRPMRDAIVRRYEMIPYVYTENRRCMDTGVSLCRPMYYDHPAEEAAYKYKRQYQFGEQLVVAPVVTPADKRSGMASVGFWLPKGRWFDLARGEWLNGGKEQKRMYMLSEVPVFAREGAIWPGRIGTHRIKAGGDDLLITVVPGASGEYTLYEDDGVTPGYLKGECAWVKMSHATGKNVMNVRVHPVKGTYRGLRKSRALEVRFLGVAAPQEVTIGGERLEWAYRLNGAGWTYDGNSATLVVRVGSIDLSQGATLRVRFPKELGVVAPSGHKGRMARLHKVLDLARLVLGNYVKVANERMPAKVAQTGNRISYNPSEYATELAQMRRDLPGLRRTLEEMRKVYGKEHRFGEGPEGAATRADRCRLAIEIVDSL